MSLKYACFGYREDSRKPVQRFFFEDTVEIFVATKLSASGVPYLKPIMVHDSIFGYKSATRLIIQVTASFTHTSYSIQ